MFVFCEITSRFEQCSSSQVRHDMLSVLVPWLHNINLNENENTNGTQIVLNNLFYLTCKFGEQFPSDFELLWAVLVSTHEQNLAIICRFLFVMVSFATYEMLSHTKRVCNYLSKVCPKRVVENLVKELECMDSLCAALDKLDDFPYYKFTRVIQTAQQQHPTQTLSDKDINEDDDDEDLDEDDEDDEEQNCDDSLEQSHLTSTDDSMDDSEETESDDEEVDSDDTDCSHKQFKYNVTKATRRSSKAIEGFCKILF